MGSVCLGKPEVFHTFNVGTQTFHYDEIRLKTNLNEL